MMPMIEQFICRSDNYCVILHDDVSNQTIAIDAPDANEILKVLEKRGLSLDVVLITHHHHDHIEGITTLKEKTNAKIIGPYGDILGLDAHVQEGDQLFFGTHPIHIIETPGHTLDHICYYIPSLNIVFTGDTLFSLGCGRLFEGTASMMFHSLQKLRALPDATKIYCGHEYTADNARFALTIDPNNEDLKQRAKDVEILRAQGHMTLPSTLIEEKRTNPFLRWDNINIRQNMEMDNASDEAVFTAIRQAKDSFR